MSEECIFCKIINNQMPSDKVYEDNECIVIMDRFPNNIGQCLVIPKIHVQNIFELDDELSGKILKVASKIAKGMQNALKPDGIHLLQNNGRGANQTVNHFHMHIIPRYFDDTIQIKWINNKFTDQEFFDTAQKIKDCL